MSSLRTLPILIVLGLLTASLSSASTHPKKKNSTSAHPTSKAAKASHHTSKKSRKARTRGQQAIDGERTRQIQQALMREHYMTGEPSGKWDDATQQALRRYQADQGWQSKTVPDSRALIRLGLGPDHGHLLNPESAMTTEPQFPHGTQSATRALGSPSTASGPTPAASSGLPGTQSSTPLTVPASTPPDLSPSR